MARTERGTRWAGLLLAACGLAAFAAALVALQSRLPAAAGAAGSTVTVLSTALTAYACFAAGRAAGRRTVAGRLWRRLALVCGLVTATVLAHLIEDARSPAGTGHGVSLPPVVLFLAAGLVLLWALLALPAPRRTGHQWLTLALDASTVLVAVGLYVWYVANRYELLLEPIDRPTLAGLGLFALVGVVVVLRVCLTRDESVDRTALSLLGAAVLVGVVIARLTPVYLGPTHLFHATLSAPVSCAVLVLAAARQARTASHVRPRRHRAGRPFSLLPYTAAAATGVLVVIAGPNSSAEARVVVTTAVGLAALVLTRQLITFYENARLMRQIDAGMLGLRRQEQRFRSLVQHASDIILITTVDGRVEYASPALPAVLGVPLENLVGQSLAPIIHPDDRVRVAKTVADVAAARDGAATYQVRVAHADGGWRWLEIVSRNLLGDPTVRGIVSNASDITEARRFQDQLAYQASHDDLTGLPNRSLLLSRTAAALAADTAPVSMALIDIDDFKAINDRLGHGVGDDLLASVGRMLLRRLGPEHTVARLGGDEYAVLLAGTPEQTEAEVVALIAALEEPVRVAGYDLLVQASIGLAHGASGATATELMRRADVALYAAKERGKGRFVPYTPDLDARTFEHARLGAELRQALDVEDQLYLLYQPIVTLPDGRLRGVEALVRWKHPERGTVSPGEFIPVAERTGQIVPLGRWILREACAQGAAWAADDSITPVAVSVNVSARQLREPGFPEDLAAALAETGLTPDLLTVEVTETAVFDSDQALETLRAVHGLGVNIALDDFGTGHSSLGLLRTCPVDVIKVDKSFIDGVTGSAEHAAIAISLIQITRTLRLLAVAEGVETDQQAERLHELGYRLAQGFHFARPLAAADVRRMLLEVGPAAPVTADEEPPAPAPPAAAPPVAA